MVINGKTDFRLEGKIDYYSATLTDASVGGVMELLGMPVLQFGNDVLQGVVPAWANGIEKVMYVTPCARIQVRLMDHKLSAVETALNAQTEDFSMAEFFSRKYSWVRVECAGQELDNLRALGFVPEDEFRKLEFWDSICTSFKLTRVDFAFDFINHPIDLPLELGKVLSQLQAESVFRLITGKSSGLGYRVDFTEKNHTVYLGATGKGNTEFLRIYDKKLERGYRWYKTPDSLLWPEDAEHYGCESWTRIELQCRVKTAPEKLFTEAETSEEMLKRVLKYCFTGRYRVRPSKKESFPFLEEFFDVEQVKNLHFI